MKNRALFSLAACASMGFVVFAAWRRMHRPLIYTFIAGLGLSASAQNWSTFLDQTRAIDWSNAGFSVPNYTAACPTQPSLLSGSGAASANTASIKASIASCDATHNVVKIPAGTWYLNGLYVQASNVVIRGAGPNSTTLIPVTGVGCGGGQQTGICALDPNDVSFGSVIEPGGSQACSSWSAGYSKGATTLTLTGCGGTPPLNGVMGILQSNDTSDTNGIYICDDTTSNCSLEGPGANDGPVISGVTNSEQQYTKITGVTSVGSGSYSVTISPGVYFTNIRSSQHPYAFWLDTLTHVGYENLSIDGSTMSAGHPTDFGNLGFYQCQQCWMKNVRSMNAGRYHIEPFLSYQIVIRDSYFYGALGGGSQSYAIEFENTSNSLVENNIFQQVTAPIMVGGGNAGNVFGYNYSLDDFYDNPPDYAQSAYFSHNAGNNMNLFEGNNFVIGPWGDDIHGATDQVTLFRNMSPGWYAGKLYATQPFIARSKVRGVNIVGGVYGQPGYHTQYQSYATSSTGGTGVGLESSLNIYSFGWLASADQGCTVQAVSNGCDPLVFNTAMRWGNYDVVTGAVRWDPTEASPGAVPYMNANFTSSYFGSLAHTLPASLYYSSKPTWWTSGKNWPAIGPDVSTGNVGMCTGTYSGAQGTASNQCAGGTLNLAWASHVTSIPAQDCYLNVMHGAPDGSGNVLGFDASACYSSSSSTTGGSGPGSPTGLTAVVQ